MFEQSAISYVILVGGNFKDIKSSSILTSFLQKFSGNSLSICIQKEIKQKDKTTPIMQLVLFAEIMNENVECLIF
jgi:hypothetical protein